MARYIDADKLIKKAHTIIVTLDGEVKYNCRHISLADVVAIQTADVRENVKGEWIPIGEPDKDNNQQVECSRCHAGDLHAVGVEVPYCWKCGADMRGKTDGKDKQ